MTLADRYRRRAAAYAKQALAAEPRRQAMYAELAKAWRELADAAERQRATVPAEIRTFKR